eukprot:2869609-Alexandrium_andersonii.AAC.1
MSLRTASGARPKRRRASSVEMPMSRRNRSCTASSGASVVVAAWAIAAVRYSRNDSTCALYSRRSSALVWKRRVRTRVRSFHPLSKTQLCTASCISS